MVTIWLLPTSLYPRIITQRERGTECFRRALPQYSFSKFAQDCPKFGFHLYVLLNSPCILTKLDINDFDADDDFSSVIYWTLCIASHTGGGLPLITSKINKFLCVCLNNINNNTPLHHHPNPPWHPPSLRPCSNSPQPWAYQELYSTINQDPPISYAPPP